MTCTTCVATHYCSRACQVEHESPIFKANQELAALKKELAEQEETLGVDHHGTLSTACNASASSWKSKAN